MQLIMEDTVAKGYLKDNQRFSRLCDRSAEEAGSAIAFQKGSELTEEFNTELKKMIENGEMEKLM